MDPLVSSPRKLDKFSSVVCWKNTAAAAGCDLHLAVIISVGCVGVPLSHSAQVFFSPEELSDNASRGL